MNLPMMARPLRSASGGSADGKNEELRYTAAVSTWVRWLLLIA